MTNDFSWRNARNILCIRLDHFGDVLMATPAIRALKQSLPERRITLLAAPHGRIVAPFIPEIDDVIEYSAPWMKSSAEHDVSVDFAMVQALQERQFDAAVIFTTYSQSPLPAAMLCLLARIPLRLAHCHENPYQLLTNWLPDPEPDKTIRHEVRRQLDLVASVECHTDNTRLSFAVTDDDLAAARQCLQAAGLQQSDRWLLIHPGATAASRRYPVTHWVQVAASLAKQGFSLLLTGSASETALVDQIIRQTRELMPHAPIHSMAGALTLGQLGALISIAPVLIVNNTGPAHLAAAVGTPLVDLYALTNPQHAPWQVASRVLFHDVACRFCYKSTCPQQHNHCLTKVEPSRVVAATLELLQEAQDKSLVPNVPTGLVGMPPRGLTQTFKPLEVIQE